jgi:hypothetical protein
MEHPDRPNEVGIGRCSPSVSFETFFAVTSQTIGTSVQVSLISRFFDHPTLGRNEELFWVRMESFRNEPFVPARTVSSRRVNEIDPELECALEDFFCVFPSLIGPKVSVGQLNASRHSRFGGPPCDR